MKKLLFAGMLLAAFQAGAQNSQTLSIMGGPSTMRFFSGAQVDGPAYPSKGGWEAGLDYNFASKSRCNLKLGFRYHESGSIFEEFLMYESEYSTGTYVYDPILGHTKRFEYRNKAWLFLVGTRFYLSRLKTWRWYTDGEIGITRFAQQESSAPPAAYPTAGLGLGLQWLPPEKHFGAFIQPMLRYMDETHGYYNFITPALEIGLRAQIFRASSIH
ncbi:MAG: hypothetical protein ABIQ93_08685 [Saprospiraceae bacterium]